MLVALVLSAGVTYGFWDTLSGAGNVNLNTGEWHKNKSTSDFVNDTLFNDWTRNEDGETVVIEKNPVYENYTREELEEAADILEEFYENFLGKAVENGVEKTYYPDRASVRYVDIKLPDSIDAGESVQISKIIEFSNFSQEVYWSPILISIALEHSGGADISDYMVEILPDYAAMQSFQYTYLYIDRERAYYDGGEGSFAQGSANVSVQSGLYLTSDAYTDITVNRLNGEFSGDVPLSSAVTYRHTLKLPTKTGSYGRLPAAKVLSVNKPEIKWKDNKSHYAQMLAANGDGAGAYIIGKANGMRSELRLSFDSRVPIVIGSTQGGTPVYQSSVPVIINISRALRVDSQGRALAEQNTSAAVPNIKFKIVQGQTWNLEEA